MSDFRKRVDPLSAETPEDSDTVSTLKLLGDRHKTEANRIQGVRTVLVVLSTQYVFDVDSLRQKILLGYSDAAVFFVTTSGKPLGVRSPKSVDLLIDLTGPGQRQGWFFAKRLRKLVRIAIGRNAGFFRKSVYDKIFDEKAESKNLPSDPNEKERQVQRKVLELAGVPFVRSGNPTPDRAKSMALDLPALNED